MTIEKLNTDKLFTDLDAITEEFLLLITSARESIFNIIPFEDSWTVAQLATHVRKSNNAIEQGLEMQGLPAERNVDERVDELKKTFLNFKAKFQSPEFILPAKENYIKEEVVARLQQSVNRLKELREKSNLFEVISSPALGEITKFEMLNFVVFHTKRHIRQLKNILEYF
jgi:hypothetical protein